MQKFSLAYDEAANNNTVTDRRGNATVYTRNAAGQLVSRTDPTGATWSWKFDDEGLLTESSEPLGRVTTYIYDRSASLGSDGRRGQGDLIETRVSADARGANGSAPLLVTRTTYHPTTHLPVTITDPRGKLTTIDRDSAGLIQQVRETIAQATTPGGQPTERTTLYEYNAHGQPTKTTNANGHVTEYQYFGPGASEGYLQKIIADPAGLALTTEFETDNLGRVTATLDPRGVRHEQVYNEADWLVEARQAVTVASAVPGGPLNYVTRLLYDANGNRTEIRRPYGDAGGELADYTSDLTTYGVLNEPLTLKRQLEPTNSTNGNLFTLTTLDYDGNRNRVRLTTKIAETVPPEVQITEWSYDPRDLLASQTRGVGTLEASTESYQYNEEGQLTHTTDGRGKIWESLFDGYGRPAGTLDPLGNRQEQLYDDQSNPVTTRALDTAGFLLAESTTLYDLLARPTAVTRYLWDNPAAGTAGIRPSNAQALTWESDYDDLNHVIQTRTPADAQTPVRIATFQFDDAERLTTTVDPLGNTTTLTLDAASNPTTVTTLELPPGGGTPVTVTESATYDGLNRRLTQTDGEGNPTLFAYDARSNPRFTTDPEGHQTEQRYDGLDRLVKTLQPEGIIVTRNYDLASRLTDYIDAAGQTTHYGWDTLNRQTTITYPDLTTSTTTYDKTDLPFIVLDPNQTQVTNLWDDARRMTGRSVLRGPGIVGPSAESYTFDGLNRRTQATSGSGANAVTCVTDFDSLSRPIQETTSDSHGSRPVVTQYDPLGNPVALTYPSGYVVDQRFDRLDRLHEVGSISTPAVTYGYRGPFLVAQRAYANGLAGTTTFDGARRQLTTSLLLSASETLFEETLTWSRRSLKLARSRGDLGGAGWQHRYDGAARLLERAATTDPLTALPNNAPEPLTPLGSLTESHSFSYDAQQNLIAKTGTKAGFDLPTTDLPPDNRNRPTAIAGNPLTWDANGNLISKGDLRLQYDFRNRLTRITDPAGIEIATYSYDTLNRRVAKTVGADTTVTTWNGWQSIEETKNGQLTRRRLYGNGLDEVVQIQAALTSGPTLDQTYTPIYDSTTNLAGITGPDGHWIEQYQYTPLGQRQVLVDATPPKITWMRRTSGATSRVVKFSTSEEVSLGALQAGVASGALRLEQIPGNAPLLIESVLPKFDNSALAGRRAYKLKVVTPPGAETQIRLVIEPTALVDLFGNQATSTYQSTPFNWAAASVLYDNEKPSVQRVSLHPCTGGVNVRIEYSETVSTAKAKLVTTLDGATYPWSRNNGSAYALTSPCLTLAPGNHNLHINTQSLDTSGNGLEVAFDATLPVTSPQGDLLVFQMADANVVSASATGTELGFQGRPVDAETGWVYFRNRYYDPEMGRFVTTDPMGYVDGPSLYQAFGYDAVNMGDPMGLCLGANNIPCSDSLKSAAGYGVGLLESGVNLALTMPKMLASSIADVHRGTKRMAGAYREGGLSGAYAEGEQLRQEKVEQNKEMLLGMVPGYNTYKEGSKIGQTCREEGAFACGRQIGKTTFNAGLDASLAYGAAKSIKSATDLGPTMEAAVDGAFKGVARESRAGALSSSGSGVAPPVPSVIYREGTPRPGNLTPRAIDNGELSFRDSLSNPFPPEPGQRPVLRPGKPYFGVNTRDLPPGSVIPDNIPPGHVHTKGLAAKTLRDAVVERGKFPKGD